jgi:predicted aconitase
MNIQETLKNLKTIGDEVAELQRKAKEARKAALEPFLASLAESGLVSVITIRGSTPGFNDGEPCEHSADLWVNIKRHAEDEVDETDELGDLFEDLIGSLWRPEPGELEENQKICANSGHVYSEPPAEIMAAISAVIFDSIEEDNGTDYYVTFILKNGKFERHEGEYDCGY